MKNVEVCQTVTLWDGERLPQVALIVYRPADPFALEIAIPSPGGRDPVSVVFGRALLIDGLERPAGEGDVRVEPLDADRWITLTLTVAGCRREFYAQRDAIEAFVDRACGVLPLGREREHLDLDGVISRLVGESIRARVVRMSTQWAVTLCDRLAGEAGRLFRRQGRHLDLPRADAGVPARGRARGHRTRRNPK